MGGGGGALLLLLIFCDACVHVAGVFPSAWYENVREIATKSPLLLSVGAEQYLDKELELNHPLKIEVIAPVSTTIPLAFLKLFLFF